MRFNVHILLLMTIMLCSPWIHGCSPHRVVLAPIPVPEGGEAFSEVSTDSSPEQQNWWENFGDAKLDTLIRLALDDNFDVMRALARLDQAASLLTQALAARLPAVNFDAALQLEWLESEQQDNLSRAGGTLAWEMDVFNRLGAAALSRRSEAAALRENVEAVRLSLTTAVAEAYFDAVEQRNQLALLKEQIAVDRDLLALTELRFKAGLTASVDVLQQSSQLAETESLVPPAEAALRVSENRLDVLTGQAPDAVDRTSDKDRFGKVNDLPFLGVPSDLLLQRPDLRALQNELVAADAAIGQAIAERLPRIVLNGTYIYEDGPELSGTRALLLGSLVQPLLDWGARKAEVARSKAVYTQRLAAFSQAYLQAIEDVENALYRERKQRTFLERLERRRQFLERTVDETRDRYTSGLTDFLPVLDAIKGLQEVERIIVREQRVFLGIRIQLHRALGGRVTAA